MVALKVDLRDLCDRGRSGWIVPPGLRDRRDRDRHHQTVSPPSSADYDATCCANSDEHNYTNLDPNRATYVDAEQDTYICASLTQSDIHSDAFADGYACSAYADIGQGTQTQFELSS